MTSIQKAAVFILAAAAIPVLCAPVPIKLEDPYVAEPKRRGTLSLFWSCAVTYGLCIWTAVHKDIVPFASVKHRLYYKMLWVLCALVLPEFLLIIALSQLLQAVRIRNHWCRRFPDTMGLQGGFFLLMGGYTIKRAVSTEKPEMLITLTQTGFKRLVDNIGRFDIPEDQPKPSLFKRLWLSLFGKGETPWASEKAEIEEKKKKNLQDLMEKFLENPFDSARIDDKGKADSISKTIVSFQALWMLQQCISRKVKGLPITLTEIHVAIQILYAAVMYACWWFKPLDVNLPIEIPVDDELWHLLFADASAREEGASISGSDTRLESAGEQSSLLPSNSRSLQRPSAPTNDAANERGATRGPRIDGHALLSLPIGSQDASKYPDTASYSADMPLVIESTDWNHNNMIYRMNHVVFSNFIYNDGHSSEFFGMALSILNGFLHGLAWNHYFPTPTEEILWKVSCFGIALCPIATYLVSLTGDCTEAGVHAVWKIRFRGEFHGPNKAKTWSIPAAVRDFLHARNSAARMLYYKKNTGSFEVEKSWEEKNESPGYSFRLTAVLPFVFFVGYTLSIMYFAVEAFVSIRSLPAGSYDIPSWNAPWPHVS
jgi:hypothetical protein